MPRYLFAPEAIFLSPVPPAVTVGINQPFELYDDRVGGSKVTDCTTTDGLTPLSQIGGKYQADGRGQPFAFYGPNNVFLLWIDSGSDTRQPLFAVDVYPAVVQAVLAWIANGGAVDYNSPQFIAAVVAAAPAGGGSGASSWDTLSGKPTTFPPTSHTHPVSQVSDASDVGKAVMKAADAATARTAIGAGTGNGTSNLAIGTTANTAAAGNHAHKADAVTFAPPTGGPLTATDVQAAIVQASQLGGGGSGTSVQRRNASESTRGYPTTTPLDIFDDRGTGVPPTWYQPGLDVLLSAV